MLALSLASESHMGQNMSQNRCGKLFRAVLCYELFHPQRFSLGLLHFLRTAVRDYPMF